MAADPIVAAAPAGRMMMMPMNSPLSMLEAQLEEAGIAFLARRLLDAGRCCRGARTADRSGAGADRACGAGGGGRDPRRLRVVADGGRGRRLAGPSPAGGTASPSRPSPAGGFRAARDGEAGRVDDRPGAGRHVPGRGAGADPQSPPASPRDARRHAAGNRSLRRRRDRNHLQHRDRLGRLRHGDVAAVADTSGSQDRAA